MHRLEALRILEAKLAAIEEDQAECAENEDSRPIDAKAEARALAAVFDFLNNCKIAPTDSLLRIFSAICVHRGTILRWQANSGPRVAGELKG